MTSNRVAVFFRCAMALLLFSWVYCVAMLVSLNRSIDAVDKSSLDSLVGGLANSYRVMEWQGYARELTLLFVLLLPVWIVAEIVGAVARSRRRKSERLQLRKVVESEVRRSFGGS